jgi:hypothetical protein
MLLPEKSVPSSPIWQRFLTAHSGTTCMSCATGISQLVQRLASGLKDSWVRSKRFSYSSKRQRPTRCPPPLANQCETGVISLWLKRPGREADDSSIYSRDEEQVEVYSYSLSRLHTVHRGFTFLLHTHTVLSLWTCLPASFRPEFISRDSRAHRASFPYGFISSPGNFIIAALEFQTSTAPLSTWQVLSLEWIIIILWTFFPKFVIIMSDAFLTK